MEVGLSSESRLFYGAPELSGTCRDPSPWETRGTQLIVTRGTCYQSDHHYPDSPKDMHGVDILSGPPQGRANDAGRAYTSG